MKLSEGCGIFQMVFESDFDGVVPMHIVFGEFVRDPQERHDQSRRRMLGRRHDCGAEDEWVELLSEPACEQGKGFCFRGRLRREKAIGRYPDGVGLIAAGGFFDV